MEYKVIRRFRDKYTREIILPGTSFHSDEIDRVENLIERGFIDTDSNPEKKPDLPQKQSEPKHTGGGWYELEDGTRIRGKEAAYQAAGW